MHGNAFCEIAIILTLATVLGVLGQKLRQPLLIMFLVTGILVGPAGLGIIKNYNEIDLLANIGISILLFIVGLKLDLKLIRTTGPVALATGLGQIVFTSVIGFVIVLALGKPLMDAAYISVALTFSSTIIIVKLLSDKKEIDTLHGQIAVGFLIVQDIAAILALVGLTTFGSPLTGAASPLMTSMLIVGKGIGMLVAVALITRYVLPPLAGRLAGSQEMVTLFAIAWAVFLGAVSEWLGFSKEVGAFLAGISLASTDYRDSIGARLTTLRDFLLLFFFIALGARLEWATVSSQLVDSLILSIFVLVGNPLIVLVIMGFMGYRRRTSFMAGLAVAQISEFSLIVSALGLSLGHIAPESMGLITLVGVGTICLSTYMILYSEPMYHVLSGALKVFERKNPYRETGIEFHATTASIDVILVGLGNYGSGLAEYLLRRNKIITGVDFHPGVLDRWRSRGISVLYGDVSDLEIYENLPLKKAQWVVNTVRSRELSLALVQNLKHFGYKGKLALTATSQAEAELFQRLGAHVVFRPFADAAEQAADSLTEAMDLLPKDVNWPIAFREVRIRPEATVAGQTIRNIPLRSLTGISVLTVSRAGRVYHNPEPDFQIYPGDRVVVMGPPEGLREAEAVLNQIEANRDKELVDQFELAEIQVSGESKIAGKSLAELRIRQTYGVTVVGIRRNESQITKVTPAEQVLGEDSLIVIGPARAIENLKKEAPL